MEQVKPEMDGVLQSQGIPLGTVPSDRVKTLYDTAANLFNDLATPIGIAKEISIDAFSAIYRGEGLNEPDTPLEHIYPNAQFLALAAVTLGKRVSEEIESLYKKNMALAVMLDSVASYSADKASRVLQTLVGDRLVSESQTPQDIRVLWYSPGYCGWHISGQQKLFAALNPQQIDMTLTERFLMIPLKSISGVLVAGDPNIHRFPNTFPFCAHCKNHNCRYRQ